MKEGQIMAEVTVSDPVGWRLNPDYEVAFDPIPARVGVRFGGATLRADGDAHPYG